MSEQWEKQKIAVVIVVVLIFLGFNLWEEEPTPLAQGTLPFAQQDAELKGIKVYVSGAVRNPGIYELQANSRALDAINCAGDFLPEADRERVNLAKKCKDGMQINVPRVKAKREPKSAKSPQQSQKAKVIAQPLPKTSQQKQSFSGKVNINTADQKTLETLPGVGKATAAKIIAQRSKQPFADIKDIMKVPGIGKAKFNRMRDHLEV